MHFPLLHPEHLHFSSYSVTDLYKNVNQSFKMTLTEQWNDLVQQIVKAKRKTNNRKSTDIKDLAIQAVEALWHTHPPQKQKTERQTPIEVYEQEMAPCLFYLLKKGKKIWVQRTLCALQQQYPLETPLKLQFKPPVCSCLHSYSTAATTLCFKRLWAELYIWFNNSL